MPIGDFYGIGIGPGDPELLTLKAARIIKAVDVIFVPKAGIKEESMALDIVKPLLDDVAAGFSLRNRPRVVEKVFPMVKEQEKLESHWKEAALAIKEELEKGNSVAFLTIGDPLTFSTYVYLLRCLRDMIPEEKIHTIPGVTSFNAAASLANLSLAQRDERIAIVPVPDDVEELRPILKGFDTVILMKVAKRLDKVINLLEEMDLSHHALFASHVGLKDSYLTQNLSELKGSGRGYMSIIIVRKKL
ncbi:MAG: precorrin-2 C(20)-methyltransferase [Planctomycetes bacterium RIFCSPHIGHO2_12_FULL_52_36]|nr:MAG: precorrin-2 C(20)-methyltransferase [Planctomycetes bacterium RIFCSPHIGHO2_12_FULL_52_36]